MRYLPMYLLKSHGHIDDYVIFSKLAPNIQSRIASKSDLSKLDFEVVNIENIFRS